MTPVRPIAEWKALAAQFRPYVHLVDSTVGDFDYDDPYQPSSVEWYLGQCRLKVRYDPDVDVVHPTARQMLMHNVPQAYLEPDSEEVYLGDRATAPYYVHIFPGPSGSVELDYWFYYPYNGPAMTGAAPSLAYWGRHEGDWEHVTVRIGGSPYKVLAARFAAHGSEDVGFISPGKDASAETFQVLGQRTVAYSAFHTHASYPDPGDHVRSSTWWMSVDVTGVGHLWDGDVELISISPALLPPGESFTEPDWLHWRGRWGSSEDSDYSTAKSPEGPSYGKSWHPPKLLGWSAWDVLYKPPRGVNAVGGTPALAARGSLGFQVAQIGPSGNSLSYCWTQQGPDGWTEPGPFYPIPVAGASPAVFVRCGNQMLMGMSLAGGRLYVCSQYLLSEQIGWNGWALLSSGFDQRISSFDLSTDDQGRVHLLVATRYGLYDLIQRDPVPESLYEPAIHVLQTQPDRVLAYQRNDSRLAAVVATSSAFGLLWQSSLGYWDGQRWNGQTTKFAQSLPIGTAPPTDVAETMDNKLVLFGVSSADKQAYRCEQKVTGEDGNWTPWYSLGDRQVVSVTASVGVGGNLTALARTNKGLVYQSERSVSGEWSEMLEFGTGMGPVALGGNADGRLEAFGIWGGAVQHRWQQVST